MTRDRTHVPKANLPKANLLVVDDNPDNVRLLAAMLDDWGYRVRKALNGKTALKTVQTAPPDLILLDITMPGLDGYDVCQQLKQDEETRNIPIIFISALNDALDKVKAFNVGGADYITKPFQSEEVLARIEHQLLIRQQQQQLQSQNQQLQVEIREREKALRDREKAEAALRIFLHAVSHDLRNPVIGTSMVLKNLLRQQQTVESDLPDATKNGQASIAIAPAILERMIRSCDRQLSLIESLVETNEIDVWGVPLQCEPLALYPLAQQLADSWEPMLAQYQAKIDNQITADLPAANADPNQLWRVFENLIANALKHNPSGVTITLSAEQLSPSRDRAEPTLRCTVADNGVGMDANQCEGLFDLYKRGYSAKRTRGLGLGLYLCRQIINAHGGEIGVISQPECGAKFWFTLPAAQSES